MALLLISSSLTSSSRTGSSIGVLLDSTDRDRRLLGPSGISGTLVKELLGSFNLPEERRCPPKEVLRSRYSACGGKSLIITLGRFSLTSPTGALVLGVDCAAGTRAIRVAALVAEDIESAGLGGGIILGIFLSSATSDTDVFGRSISSPLCIYCSSTCTLL